MLDVGIIVLKKSYNHIIFLQSINKYNHIQFLLIYNEITETTQHENRVRVFVIRFIYELVYFFFNYRYCLIGRHVKYH